MIEEYGLNNVELTGEVEHHQIPEILEKAHIFVSASKMEVQSLVVIEALASGTPVVCLSNETTDELIDDSLGIRLPAEADPVEFARAVEKISNLSPDAYQAMCQNARTRVQHLDWARARAHTVELYRQLVAQQNLLAYASAQRQRQRVAKIIALVPSHELREDLEKWLAGVSEHFQGKKWLPVKREKRGQARVSAMTWFAVGLTVALSYLVFRLMKPGSLFSRP
jgi:hypothetical protein